MTTSPSKTAPSHQTSVILGVMLGLLILVLLWLYQGLPSLLLMLMVAGAALGWQLEFKSGIFTKAIVTGSGAVLGFALAYLFMLIGGVFGPPELALLPVGALWLLTALHTGMNLARWGGEGVVMLLLLGTAVALVVVAGIFIRYELRPCGLLDKALRRSTCLREFNLGDHYLSRVVLSPDGSLLGVAAYDYLRVWQTDATEWIYEFDESVTDIAFSPDNTLMAIAFNHNYVDINQVSSGKQLHRLSIDRVKRVAFSPNGKLVAAGGAEAGKIFQADTGVLHRVLWDEVPSYPPQASSMAFSPDGKLLAVGFEDGTIGLWRMVDGAQIRTLQHSLSEDNYRWVTALAFSPDGTLLASGSGEHLISIEENFVKLWQVRDGTLLGTIAASSYIFSLAFSPDNTRLQATFHDGTLRAWSIPDVELLAEQAVYPPEDGMRESDLRYTPAGLRLAAASWYDKDMQLWHIPESANVTELE